MFSEALLRELESSINEMMDKKLVDLGVDPEQLGHRESDYDRAYAMADQVWRNNGWVNPEQRYRHQAGGDRESQRIGYKALCDALDEKAKLQDAIETTSASILLPRVITRIVREAAEPILIGTSLMRRINFSAGDTITFPASGGGMWAEDIPPGGEYPEQSMEFAGYVTANIGKSGLKVRITDEMIRFSMFDVMSMHMQAASRALARHKENKIFTLIANEGRTAFDNANPGSSRHGRTTGRNINLLFNKTITLDDLFIMYADLLNAGFIPNTLLMNPMGWLIFARDGTMRAFGFANNGNLWQAHQGQPGQGPNYTTAGGVNMGPSAGQDPDQLNPQANLYTNVPSIFPAPMTIAVSPFVYFNQTNQSTDIIMADRDEFGILVVDEDPVTESWDDPKRDIRSTKIRERYGLALDNQGEAVIQAKEVRIDRNYDWEDNIRLAYQYGSGESLPTGLAPGV